MSASSRLAIAATHVALAACEGPSTAGPADASADAYVCPRREAAVEAAALASGASLPLAAGVAWSDGRVVYGLSYRGTPTWGPATGGGGTDFAVVEHRHGPVPAVLRTTGFGGPGDDWIWDLAAAPNGDLVIVGTFEDDLTIGSLHLTSAGAGDLFVARLAPAGEPLWATAIGGPGDEGLSVDDWWRLGSLLRPRLAVGPDGEVVLSSWIDGAIELGTRSLTDHVLIKLSPTGDLDWARQVDGWGPDVAIDADGSIVLGGTAMYTTVFGGQLALPGAAILARLDRDGETLWARVYEQHASSLPLRVAVGTGGEIVLAGNFSGLANLGGEDLNPEGAIYGFNAVAKYTPGGAHVWSQVLAYGGFVDDLAVDTSGAVVIAASNMAWPELVKLSADGRCLWHSRSGDDLVADSDEICLGVAVDPPGRVAAVWHALWDQTSGWGAVFTTYEP